MSRVVALWVDIVMPHNRGTNICGRAAGSPMCSVVWRCTSNVSDGGCSRPVRDVNSVHEVFRADGVHFNDVGNYHCYRSLWGAMTEAAQQVFSSLPGQPETVAALPACQGNLRLWPPLLPARATRGRGRPSRLPGQPEAVAALAACQGNPRPWPPFLPARATRGHGHASHQASMLPARATRGRGRPSRLPGQPEAVAALPTCQGNPRPWPPFPPSRHAACQGNPSPWPPFPPARATRVRGHPSRLPAHPEVVADLPAKLRTCVTLIPVLVLCQLIRTPFPFWIVLPRRGLTHQDLPTADERHCYSDDCDYYIVSYKKQLDSLLSLLLCPQCRHATLTLLRRPGETMHTEMVKMLAWMNINGGRHHKTFHSINRQVLGKLLHGPAMDNLKDAHSTIDTVIESVNAIDPYHGVTVVKEECINHVAKRMYKGLERVVREGNAEVKLNKAMCAAATTQKDNVSTSLARKLLTNEEMVITLLEGHR
ncbi:hypothetical protein NP493_53g02003 [Ridgeia piscesae]|uniref:Uncharacterized protein n=1 Tax=Ridgeia piscesae TaxID=27915 RepID=A0AAD9PAQ7_RIDPI|nr:hypothetical protein NP493_53g02003 [Ridgeia piscesae]